MLKILSLILIVSSFSVNASTNFLPTLMTVYPQVAGTVMGDCMTCHTIDKWQRNAYGQDLQAYLRANYDGGEQDPQRRVYSMEFIASGLDAIADKDSDGDGVSNWDEFQNLTFPGDASDF